MENSASLDYIQVTHRFTFNYSKIRNLQPEQFVSSPVFHALGNEWVIDCYPRGSFLVRLHGAYKTVKPTFTLSLRIEGMSYRLSYQDLKGDLFRSAVQKSPFQEQVFAYGEDPNLILAMDLLKVDSFELFCSMETDVPHNSCSLGVLKSFALHSQIGELLESSEKADVTFHVKNRSFMCHRLILAARSPVFKAMLFGNMAEATQQQIEIADMCPKVFEAMLHFIYTDSVPDCNSDKTSENFTKQLFVAADRYAIEGLKALCEDKLRGHISLNTVKANLVLAQQHHSPRLKKACIDFIEQQRTLINWLLSDD